MRAHTKGCRRRKKPHLAHSTPIFETCGVGGLNAGRSETALRVTYQF